MLLAGRSLEQILSHIVLGWQTWPDTKKHIVGIHNIKAEMKGHIVITGIHNT